MANPRPVSIGPGTRVTFHFSLALAGGGVIEDTRDGTPATFVVGDGNLPESFERTLVGLRAGCEERIELSPEQAFGPSRNENLKLVSRDKFDPSIGLEPGVVVSFDTPEGALPGVVKSLQGALVVVDFNHPLAGKSLIFEVSILSVEPVGE